jgi:Fur family iron response transcriptional regulator
MDFYPETRAANGPAGIADAEKSIRAAEMLGAAGLRPTRQRIALAELLFFSEDRHVTAERLFEEALAARLSVSLATVYNTLHQFTAAGLLREIAVDGARVYFDTNTSDHHHFLVEESGELLDISEAELAVVNVPAAPRGLRVERVDVVVRLRRDTGAS